MAERDGNRLDWRIESHPVLGPPGTAVETEFRFDDRTIRGRVGEPIAVALLAAGIRVFRTMPGSDEARGPYCMIGRCADCLVIVDGRPNVRACVTPVQPGLTVQTQRGAGDGLELHESVTQS